MRLIITEKPSVAKVVAARLGGGHNSGGYIQVGNDVVTWALGHLYEQAPPDHYNPLWKRWAFDALPMVPSQWALLPKGDRQRQIDVLQDLLKRAQTVVHGGDPDPEGELLIYEILETAKWRGPVSRLWLSAMDDASVDTALANLRDASKSYGMKLAAECRSRADWLIGMNLSRAATLKAQSAGGQSVLSVGRVQTPTLALVVARDREIDTFASRKFYEVAGEFDFKGVPFSAMWVPAKDTPSLDDDGRVFQKSAAAAVATDCTGAPANVSTYVTKPMQQASPIPYTLTDIQATASARFGLSAQQTLDICQALYETHKVATYPRTDCGYLPESMHALGPKLLGFLAKVPAFAPAVQGAKPALQHAAFNDAQISAHHGIIPTGGGNVAALNDLEGKIFALIALRYIALFYPPFQYLQTTVEVTCGRYLFRATGRVTQALGWKAVLGGDTPDPTAQPLPVLTVGAAGVCTGATLVEKATKPPQRFTEGSLLKAMENIATFVTNPEIKKLLNGAGGLGTPATRAQILETLKKRGFVVVEKKTHFVSTELGRQFIAGLPVELTTPDLTAAYEKRLSEISAGTGSPVEFMAKQTVATAMLVDKIRLSTATFGGGVPPEYACPQCGKGLRRIKGPSGFFWGCTGYPTCKKTVPDVKNKPDGIKKAGAAAKPRSSRPSRARTTPT